MQESSIPSSPLRQQFLPSRRALNTPALPPPRQEIIGVHTTQRRHQRGTEHRHIIRVHSKAVVRDGDARHCGRERGDGEVQQGRILAVNQVRRDGVLLAVGVQADRERDTSGRFAPVVPAIPVTRESNPGYMARLVELYKSTAPEKRALTEWIRSWTQEYSEAARGRRLGEPRASFELRVAGSDNTPAPTVTLPAAAAVPPAAQPTLDAALDAATKASNKY